MSKWQQLEQAVPVAVAVAVAATVELLQGCRQAFSSA